MQHEHRPLRGGEVVDEAAGAALTKPGEAEAASGLSPEPFNMRAGQLDSAADGFDANQLAALVLAAGQTICGTG